MFPTYVRSPADFAEVVTIGVTTETLVIEFKAEVNTRKPDQQQESCRDIAQLANTDGGCLLVGVEEQVDPVTNLKRAIGIKTVAKPDKLIQWLEQAIGHWLMPSTFSKEIVPVPLLDGVVVAVNVFPSQHTVYLWDREKHTMEVPRRTNYGKAWMNPDELERHIMNGSRATRLRIEEVVAKATNKQVELAGGYFNQAPGASPPTEIAIRSAVNLGGVGDMAFELRIPYDGKVHTLEVPYEVVQAAWVGTNGCIQLMLSARVLHRSQAFTLLPYQA